MNGPAKPGAAHPRFSDIIERLAKDPRERLYIGEATAAFGDRGLAATMLLWSIINFIPLPPGGTTITGFPLLILSMELAIGRESLWLPRSVLRASMPRSTFRKALGWLIPVIRLAERLSKPRLTFLVGQFSQGLIGLVCFLLSIVLVLPIPLGNIAPAVTMALLSLGVMQRDGLAVLLGWLSAAISFGLLALVWKVVWETVEELYQRVMGLSFPIP